MSYPAVNQSPAAVHCGFSTEITWYVLFKGFIIELYTADTTGSEEHVTDVATYVTLLNHQLKMVSRKHLSFCHTLITFFFFSNHIFYLFILPIPLTTSRLGSQVDLQLQLCSGAFVLLYLFYVFCSLIFSLLFLSDEPFCNTVILAHFVHCVCCTPVTATG